MTEYALCLAKSRNEDRTLHLEASSAGVSPRLHPTSALKIADIDSSNCNADVLNGPRVQSAVAPIDAAQRLRGDAVENGDADHRNGHDATG